MLIEAAEAEAWAIEVNSSLIKLPRLERLVETEVLLRALCEALLTSLKLFTADTEALLFNDASEALALDTLAIKLVEFSLLIDAIRLSFVLPACD